MVKPLFTLQAELEDAAQETKKAKQKVLSETQARTLPESEPSSRIGDVNSNVQPIVGQNPRGGIS